MLVTGFLRPIKILFAGMTSRSAKERRFSATATCAPAPNMTKYNTSRDV